MEFIDLKKQYERIKPRIHDRINEVLRHGKFIMGPEVAVLENQLAAYVGCKHCVSCANGLQTAFSHLGYRQGDFPVAEHMSDRIFSLPMHPYLDPDDQDRIIDAVKKAHEGISRG